MAIKTEGIKIACDNRKAWHDYFIHEKLEAGFALQGTEVKSLRAGKANLKDCYAKIINNEVFVIGMHISPYEHGNILNHDPLRTRKLLLHKSEILKIDSKMKQKGFTLIPLKVYFVRGRVKIELALASGKKNYDKRQDLADKASKRDVERALKERQRDY